MSVSRPAPVSLAQALTMALTARSRPATGWMRPARAYQPTATVDVAVAQLGQGGPLAGFGLAQVVAQRPHLLGVASGKGGEGAAGADGVELAVVADDDHLGPGPLHRPQQAGQVDIGGHPGLITNDDMPVGEGQGAVIEPPRQRGDGP